MSLTDPEGFKMLVRGALPGILENCAPDDLEATAETAVKALGKAWRLVEAACPDHTYEKAHSYGRSGGGGGGKGFAPKTSNGIVTFGKFKDKGATWRELAMDRHQTDGKYGPEGSRAYVEWLSTSDKTSPEDRAFFVQLLKDTSPNPDDHRPSVADVSGPADTPSFRPAAPPSFRDEATPF